MRKEPGLRNYDLSILRYPGGKDEAKEPWIRQGYQEFHLKTSG
jgi:hypothetical protein